VKQGRTKKFIFRIYGLMAYIDTPFVEKMESHH
jgi:hypothetical protein